MSNFNAAPTDFPINMTCSFKEYPPNDAFHYNIHNKLPVFMNYEGHRQFNTIAMHNPVGYPGYNLHQYPYNPFTNLHIKQESLAPPVIPQYHEYQNPQPPTTPEPKSTTEDEQDVVAYKPHRTRTIFTKEQLSVLEKEFRISRYPTSCRRKDLAISLDLPDKCIVTWFGNRRGKQKRLDAESKKKLEPATYTPNFNAGYSEVSIDGYDRLAAYLCRSGQ